MKTALAALAFTSVVVAAVACSSSSDSSSTSSFCCGINSAAYDCPDQAALDACTQGDTSKCSGRSTTCDGKQASTSGTGTGTSTSPSGSGTGTGGGGCSLFTCTSTQAGDCGGIAPCMKAADGKSYCYEQEASPSSCSQGTTASSATIDGMSRTLCTPSGCPAPQSYAP